MFCFSDNENIFFASHKQNLFKLIHGDIQVFGSGSVASVIPVISLTLQKLQFLVRSFLIPKAIKQFT